MKMIRSTSAAVAEAAKRWGKNGAVRDDGPKCASNDAERAEAHEEVMRLRAIPKEERAPDWREMSDAAFSRAMRYRYTVGKIVMGLFFSVEGQGDTWADAFASADRKNKVAA